MREGLVIRIDAKRCHVDVDGEVHLLSPRGRLFEDRGDQKNPVTVGDRVRVELDGEGGGSIEEVLPRASRLARAAAGEGTREQVLVANLDLVLVVASIRRPAFRAELVDRILAGAEREALAAAVVINKIDLDSKGAANEWSELYRRLGYETLLTSATASIGIDELRTILRDKITVVCGLSGAGKSSLLNAVDPDLALAVGKVSARGSREGRHTTTHSSLVRLTSGGWVVDTPGIRNFGLFDLDPTEVAWLFREMEPLLGTCEFDDCAHVHEPNCAVKRALEAGELPRSRYDSYLLLLDESKGGAL